MDPSAANPATLLGARSLSELLGTANALRPGLRVWMLLPSNGKQYLLTGEGCDALDSLVGDQASINRIPVLFEPTGPCQPWSRALLDLLRYQEDWLERTQLLLPVWEEGRLLGIIGGAPSNRAGDHLHDLIRYVGAAVRKLDQLDTSRRDLDAIKTMLRQPDKNTVVATVRGRAIGGTQGGLAVVNRILGRTELNANVADPTLPQVLRTMITKGESSAVIDDLNVHLSRSAWPAPTTVEPACWFKFSRHLKESSAPSTVQAYESLTPAERRVVALALQGKQNKEIAQALFLSHHTVKRHMRHILAKYHCEDRVTLILRWKETPAAPLVSTPTAKPMVPSLPVVTCPPAPGRKVGEAA